LAVAPLLGLWSLRLPLSLSRFVDRVAPLSG
jgi:hypothetical protein